MKTTYVISIAFQVDTIKQSQKPGNITSQVAHRSVKIELNHQRKAHDLRSKG
tara:strand:- start:199 stop:354 length:156 start_codon:yes stop_codon:yes gene_type:complete